MGNDVLSAKEWELLDILKQKAKLTSDRAEDYGVGIMLVVQKLNNIDKVIEFCRENPAADLTDILTFAGKELPILENED